MLSKRFIKQMKEEKESTRYEDGIVCPYCETEQDHETMYNHTTYWGDDSTKNTTCEHCGKEFQVEEMVTRKFQTSKIEWVKKEDARIKRLVKKSEAKEK